MWGRRFAGQKAREQMRCPKSHRACCLWLRQPASNFALGVTMEFHAPPFAKRAVPTHRRRSIPAAHGLPRFSNPVRHSGTEPGWQGSIVLSRGTASLLHSEKPCAAPPNQSRRSRSRTHFRRTSRSSSVSPAGGIRWRCFTRCTSGVSGSCSRVIWTTGFVPRARLTRHSSARLRIPSGSSVSWERPMLPRWPDRNGFRSRPRRVKPGTIFLPAPRLNADARGSSSRIMRMIRWRPFCTICSVAQGPPGCAE